MPQEEARVPVTDRGFLFGDGAYATIQVRNGTPRFLETHLERLEAQCRSFGLCMPPLRPDWIAELIRLNRAHEGMWRLKIIVTGGDLPALCLPKRTGRVLMTLQPYDPPPFIPLRIGLFPHPFSLCHAGYKSLAHLNRLYVMEEARRQGMDDCLTRTEGGIVLETAFGNLCWIVERTLFTPSRKLPLYFGVTISQMIERARVEGYAIEEVAMTLEELPKEGLYFRTNSMGGIRPIGLLHHQPLRQQKEEEAHVQKVCGLGALF
ncbi:MAG: D-alanine aminotransferase [Chlamydiales bacterium]|nr:D-alanine aminotransferase [Chlamydiales bacterium]